MVWRGDECFTKAMRLRSHADFDDLFQRGVVAVDQVLVVHGRPSRLAANQLNLQQLATHRPGRLGISIAKRVGHAPLRNRWKRLIREAYRKQVQSVPALRELDIVVRPRRGAVPNYFAIQRSLTSLANKLDRQLKKSRSQGGPNVQS